MSGAHVETRYLSVSELTTFNNLICFELSICTNKLNNCGIEMIKRVKAIF